MAAQLLTKLRMTTSSATERVDIVDAVILLVEDNPDDEPSTLWALRRANVCNEVVVARDGVEALDYLFGTGPHAGRDTIVLPEVILRGQSR